MVPDEKVATCSQCGAFAHRRFEARDRNQRMTADSFTYYQCSSCGLIFMHPVPDDLGRFYPAGYHEIPASVDALLQGKEHETFKLDAIGALGKGRRLLEIGPSFGRFAALAKAAGFRVEAIEMDPACCQFLEQRVGIRAHGTDDVANTLTGLGRFDVITLWHSLEHLRDPWVLLDALPDHLESGGLLAIATPNPQSLQFAVFGSRWVHLDAPRHVSLIPNSVLESRLSRRQMRRVHFSSRDQGARDCNVLGWFASPASMFPRWLRRRPFTSIGFRMSRFLAKLDERDPYGSAYTTVFRKDTAGSSS